AYQGRGIGHRFYTDLFSFARQTNARRVTCEFDIYPPNDLSRRFHERHGFKEVGTQSVASGKKQVSLRALSLQSEDRANPSGARTATEKPAFAAHVKR
ncbi:MAG: GNAT family N-acetyltransferase, partial [Deltaproteobacteria bacterium]|nr:GNAT family N-acetyltransferase [Deltaproteobacteria bacterium]